MKKISISLIVLTCTLFSVSSFAAMTWTECKPTGVAEGVQRMHVRCAVATAGIVYFAVPVTEKDHASRFLSLATSALLAGKTLFVNYDPSNTSGASYGCGAADCRYASAIELR